MGSGGSSLPKSFNEAYNRYQQNSRDPRQPDELVRKLKGLLERRKKVTHNRQPLEEALRAGEELEKYFAGGKAPVVVVWDKETMQNTHHSVLRQLLEATNCREVGEEDFDIDKKRNTPALYVCRTPTGRLEDMNRNKFDGLDHPKALVVLRSGNNEQSFPASYEARDITGNATLAVQFLHYRGSLIQGKLNESGVEKLKTFVESCRHGGRTH